MEAGKGRRQKNREGRSDAEWAAEISAGERKHRYELKCWQGNEEEIYLGRKP